MAKRKKSGLDELFELFVVVPAWVGPVLAVSGFVVVRWLLPPLFRAVDGGIAVGDVLAGFCEPGSWLFAGVVLVAWTLAELRKLLIRRMLDRQTGQESVRALSWSQFEELVAEAYRRRGYMAQVVGRATGDGGIDIVLKGQGERVLVQCKHWKARRVGVAKVRELAGVVGAEKADRGLLVTCGGFTPEAVAFAARSGVKLVDGAQFAAMIAEVQRDQRSVAKRSSSKPMGNDARAVSMPATEEASPAPDSAVRLNAPPACPMCEAEMVLRTARRGPQAGSQFWGCTRFPGCRGTQGLEAERGGRGAELRSPE